MLSRGACAAAVGSWTTTDHALVSHADVDVVVVFVVVVATPSDRAVRVSSSSTRPHVATTRIRIVHSVAVPRVLVNFDRNPLCTWPWIRNYLLSSFVVTFSSLCTSSFSERLFVRDSAENDVANRSTRVFEQESRGLKR